MSGAAALARAGRLGELVRWLRRGPTRWRAAMASLFAVQAALGYALMLIAMTYQARAAVPGCGARARVRVTSVCVSWLGLGLGFG